MSSVTDDEMDQLMRLDLLVSRHPSSRGLVVRCRIPGRDGDLRKVWPVAGAFLTPSQLDDVGGWLERVVREALLWKWWAGRKDSPV